MRMLKCFERGLILMGIVIMAMAISSPVFAADTSCKTKYPIILAHGMGFIPNPTYPNSFPGIVEALQARGATVYCTVVEPLGSTREKAEQFKAEFLKIKAISGAAKFNIIGHSHGGIYTRDAITNLGLAPYVASLTTVDSPHRGSEIAQVMTDISKVAPWLANMLTGLLPMAGDPEKLAINTEQLSVTYMTRVFNPNCPNVKGVYYQSWSGCYRYYNVFKMLSEFISMLIQALLGISPQPSTPAEYVAALYDMLPTLATEIFLLGGGYNDGLVSVDSAKWGTYLGTQTGYWFTKGVNHLDVVNLTPHGATFDVIGYWVKLVQGLKAKGY